jgi:hypothetical protein
VVTTDPILGQVRCCTRCAEFWPDDEEFYTEGSLTCHACSTEWLYRRREYMAAAARRYRDRIRQGQRVRSRA